MGINDEKSGKTDQFLSKDEMPPEGWYRATIAKVAWISPERRDMGLVLFEFERGGWTYRASLRIALNRFHDRFQHLLYCLGLIRVGIIVLDSDLLGKKLWIDVKQKYDSERACFFLNVEDFDRL